MGNGSNEQEIWALLGLRPKGSIDFEATFGMSFPELLDKWKIGHVRIPVNVVQEITFDEITVSVTPGGHSAIIDNYYQNSRGVVFSPYDHTFDYATGESGFSPKQGRSVGYDHPKWYDPHVYAVSDYGSYSPGENYSISHPNCVNIGDDAYGGPTQLLACDNAIKAAFSTSPYIVSIDTDYRIEPEDQERPIDNWPQMFAYDENDNLLDQKDSPHGGSITVSDVEQRIAYVMLTVNNHFAGVEPLGIFDNLIWTTFEFVEKSLRMLHSGSLPVPRRDTMARMIAQLNDLKEAQKNLQNHLRRSGPGKPPIQIRKELDAMTKQTEELITFYRYTIKELSSILPAERMPEKAKPAKLTQAKVKSAKAHAAKPTPAKGKLSKAKPPKPKPMIGKLVKAKLTKKMKSAKVQPAKRARRKSR
jgi:hypothetical protein